jgi:hypothetical protein
MNMQLSIFLLLAAMTGVEARLGQNERDLQGGLGLCQGDCDSDSDCISGMKCFHRLGGDPLPLCSIQAGEVKAKTDFCVPMGAPDSLLGPSVHYVGNQNRPSRPLELCEGDCDNDNHCVEGLICFQRNSGQPVPGCRGFDGSRTDYCIDPSALNTPAFPVTGSNAMIMFLNYTISSRFNDRRPTSQEYADLTVQTDKWFTDETDRIFGNDAIRQLQDVVVTMTNPQYLPNQPASHQIQYSVSILWNAINAESIPRNTDILAAFQPFRGQYSTTTYRNRYLSRLPNSNPFSATSAIGQGMTFP